MPKRNLIWLLVVAGTAVAAVLITRAGQRSDGGQQNGAVVGEAYRIIEQQYYPGIEPEAYREQVLARLIEMLHDPYSSYIPPQKAEALRQRILGSHRGLGIVLTARQGDLQVVGAEMGSPAHRAGVRGGDRVVRIGDQSAAGLSVAQAESLLAIEPGEEAVIELLRPGESEPTRLTVASGEFPVESVTGLLRDAEGTWLYRLGPDESIVYLRIREFVRDTVGQFHKACRLSGARGVILDLRGNPGGLLPSAIEMTNQFIREGLIVEVASAGQTRRRHLARADGTYPDVPLVVLIDEDSASGAELMAGALAANGRAVLVGVRTRGKGLVQSMISLPEKAGLMNLTTSEFFVAGRSITRRDGQAAWGVDPQLPVPVDELSRARLAQLRRVGGLVGRRLGDDDTTAAEAVQAEVDELLRLDAQLAAALALLDDPQRMQQLLDEARQAAAPAAETARAP